MSYITKCLASGQVVTENARCRVIPLLQARSYNAAPCFRANAVEPLSIQAQLVYGASRGVGICSHWAPMTGFFEAVAGDRGETYLVNTPDNLRLASHTFGRMYTRVAMVVGDESNGETFNFKALLKKFSPVFEAHLAKKVMQDEQVQISFAEATAVWRALCMEIHLQRVFIMDHSGVFRPLGLGNMHESAYQWLLKEGESTPEYGEAYNRAVKVAKLCAEAVESVDRAFAANPDRGHLPEEHRALQYALLLESALRERLMLIGESAYGDTMPWLRAMFADLKEHGSNAVEVCRILKLKAKSFLDDSYVMRAMKLCCLAFNTAQYAGQDYGNESGQRYARLVADTSKAVTHEVDNIYAD